MRTYTQQEIAERFNKLPKDLKDALSGVDLPKKVRKIAQDHHLHIDQLGTLLNVTKLTLAGLSRARDFVPTLKKVLNTDEQTVYSVASVINTQIFLPVRNSLRDISNQFFAGEEVTTGLEETQTKPQTASKTPPPTKKQTTPQPALKPEPQADTAEPEQDIESLRASIRSAMQEQLGTPAAKTPPAQSAEATPQTPPDAPQKEQSTPAMPEGIGQVNQPEQATTPETTPQEAAVSGPVDGAETTTDVSHKNTNPLLNMIPHDVKTRINSDPYKEPIG